MRYYDFGSTLRSVEDSYALYDKRIRNAILVYDKFHKSFEKRDCPFCQSSAFVSCEKFLDRYEIALCKVCNSHYVNPTPSLEALAFYYNACECNTFFTQISNLPKAKSKFNDKVVLIEQYLKKYVSENRQIINGGGQDQYLRNWLQ